MAAVSRITRTGAAFVAVLSFQAGVFGHGQVEQKDVGLQLPCQFHRFGPVGRLTQNLDVSFRFQQPAQAIAENWMIVGDNGANRTHMCPFVRRVYTKYSTNFCRFMYRIHSSFTLLGHDLLI
jgi:hypothetical protein